MDSNHRTPKRADLQSAVFDRFTTYPNKKHFLVGSVNFLCLCFFAYYYTSLLQSGRFIIICRFHKHFSLSLFILFICIIVYIFKKSNIFFINYFFPCADIPDTCQSVNTVPALFELVIVMLVVVFVAVLICS